MTTDTPTVTADMGPALREEAGLPHPTEARRERGHRRAWPSKLPVGILVGAFALSHAVAAVAGVRYDDSPLAGRATTDMWQLLDVHLLRSELIQSVWHLNSQPPLFNLYCGLVLKLPTGWQRPFEVTCSLVLGLVIVLCAYQVMVELRVPRMVAMGVTLACIVASPAYILYENWLNYAYPTAAFGVFAAWCLIRYLRSQRVLFGLGFFFAYGAMVMLNSTYQVEWMLVAVGVVLVAARRLWKQVLAVALVPLLLVGSWYVKDAAMFGTATTSSWLGMNLARMVLLAAPRTEIAQLQRQGRLTGLASVGPFGPPSAYVPRFVRAAPNPVAALGTLTKVDGASNLNNPIYITVSSRYLHDDITFIEAHPSEYLGDMNRSVQVWLVSTDQNFAKSRNWPQMVGYARVYDRIVEWQPAMDPAADLASLTHAPSPLSWLSLQATVVFCLALFGAPVVLWRRRRHDPALAATLAVLWWTTLFAFGASSLLEIGENERFRFELGPVPLIIAVVVLSATWRAVRSHRPRRNGLVGPHRS